MTSSLIAGSVVYAESSILGATLASALDISSKFTEFGTLT